MLSFGLHKILIEDLFVCCVTGAQLPCVSVRKQITKKDGRMFYPQKKNKMKRFKKLRQTESDAQ